MDEDHPAVPGGYPLSQATFETDQLSSSDDDHEAQAWPDGGDHSHSAQSVRPGADLKLDPALDGSSVHLDTARSMDATQDETRHHHEGSQHVHVDVEPTHNSIHHVHDPEEGATWRGLTPPNDCLAVPPKGQQSHSPHPHAAPQQHFHPARPHHGRHPSASHGDQWLSDQHEIQYEPSTGEHRSSHDARLARARGRQSNKPRSKKRPASPQTHDQERRYGRTYEQPQVQVIVPGEMGNFPAPGNPQTGSVAGALTEQMQMMMMSQMMMQQMAAQQIQAAQLSAITDKSGDKDKKGKKTKRPSINIKSKQVNKRRHSMPMMMPPVAVRPVGPQNTIEAAAMENWQEATIILCIAIVGLIYLVSSRSAKNDKEEASLAAKHLVPKS